MQALRCRLLRGLSRADVSDLVHSNHQLAANVIVQRRKLTAKPPKVSLKQVAPTSKPSSTSTSHHESAKLHPLAQLQELQQPLPPAVQTEPDSDIATRTDTGLFYPEQMEWLDTRLVRISRPTKNVMQSGTAYTNTWKIEFNSEKRTEYWLMGWASTSDPVSNMSLTFPTKEDAIAFCERNKLQWFVEEQPTRQIRRKSYADNFSWNKRTRTGNK